MATASNNALVDVPASAPQCLWLSAAFLSSNTNGCPVARRSWDDGCRHLTCRVAAGFLPRVALYNGAFRGERDNWLRFQKDPKKLAAAYWAGKREWAEAGRPENFFSMAWIFIGIAGDGR
jgi:hypothetical protein